MIIKQKKNVKRTVKANNTRLAGRKIRANEEIEEEVKETAINVAPEASDLLFEAEDVAELVAEVTGEEVAVTADEDVITFEVGDETYVVEAEGDEEILESTRKPLRNKKPVKAATRRVVRNRR